MPDADAAPLECSGVTKRFGRFTALEAVDLVVEPGEIFALLGPNGAGKTTLIGCVTGTSLPTSGAIRVFGHDVVREFRQARRLVGLVPQEVSFDPFFTPLQSILNQMGLMGVRPDRARAERLLEIFSLLDKKDAYTRNLSGGMKRRLLVAKALAHAPRLLFLDEPSAGVDVELRQELWSEVTKLRERGTTVILTTHYLEEAEQLADRVGVIDHGRIALVERTDRLMSRFSQNRVRFQLAAPLHAMPPGLPEGSVRVSPRELVVPWSEPGELARAIEQVQALVGVDNCEVRHTSLEEIFVKLVSEARA
ncbi:MAG: ABC transporter ATP-binding protein [Myxococcota bacterium]